MSDKQLDNNEEENVKSKAETRREGHTLPYPEPPFEGVIRPTFKASTPDFPQPHHAPKGAPNIVLIMTDDVGFGAGSTFGGPIPTPSCDKIAGMGLTYNRFHTTSLCSPTRAALLTGRNPHNANTGIVMERALGFPGYNSIISKSCGTIAEVLRQNGYHTSWFGKNHNVPTWEQSAVGPFDRWPMGMGFDYFYGFIGGDCNQWTPPVWENGTPIEPYLGREDYHLDSDLADQAIRWIEQRTALDPEAPYFLYYVPGATHAPHHVPEEWIAKFKGQFDHGWDEQQKLTWQKQLDMGIIPPGTQRTPRPANLPAWDKQTREQKELYCRMMEVYAGFLHFTDHNIGRVIDAVEKTGQMDNTLIIYIQGDNGGSGEGTLHGTSNELAVTGNGETESLDYLCAIQDELGGPMHYNHFPVPWSWAMNSPFQWMKRYACHFGGTRNGMVMSWPKKIKDAGGLRDQFHHVIDIAPTIFDAARIPWPVTNLNGVEQKDLDGISMQPFWDPKFREAKARRKTQYFEMYGNRGLYHEDEDGRGWIACTTPLMFAWVPDSDKQWELDDFEWELYCIDDDFSQAKDLMKEEENHDFYVAKLESLKAMWWKQAHENQVLPLNFSVRATYRAASQRPSLTKDRYNFAFTNGIKRIPEGVAPDVKNTSFTITAEIHVPEGKTEGVIITQGGRFAGWGLVVLDNRPIWCYKRSEQAQDGFQISGDPLLPGSHKIVVKFDYDHPGPRAYEEGELLVGRGGTFTLEVDDKPVAHRCVNRTVRAAFSVDETLDVGEDTGTPILEDYAQQMPFKFNGTIRKVTIELPPPDEGHPLAEKIKEAIEHAKFEADQATE